MRKLLFVLPLVAVLGCESRTSSNLNKAQSHPTNEASRSAATGLPQSLPETGSAAADGPAIRLVHDPDRSGLAVFEVAGIEASLLEKVATLEMDSSRWSQFFWVRVATAKDSNPDGIPPIAGVYKVEEGLIRFVPQFALEPGLVYRAFFDATVFGTRPDPTSSDSSPASPQPHSPLLAEFAIPKSADPVPAEVAHVFPSADRLPENQLKFYIHFSAPMARGEAYEHIHLLTESGSEVDHPFLELDEELWDPTGRRFTLLIHPGRIKRGLKPREEIGPVLEEGKSYTLVVDRNWHDARGRPLADSFRKRFQVGPPDESQPDPKQWKIVPPARGTTEPLIVTLPEPLDHAMLQHVLTVFESTNRPLRGEIKVSHEETRWQFTPATAWQDGDYSLVVSTELEDLAGNSIARPFEVDEFHPISKSLSAETARLRFRATD